MKRIVLIACAREMLPRAAQAWELYQGELFKLSLCFAERLEPDAIYILSAKYGLLALDQVVEPYRVRLDEMSETRLNIWATYVLGQLAMVSDLKQDQFTILAGETYRKHLAPYLGQVALPLDGKGGEEQAQFLRQMIAEPATQVEQVKEEAADEGEPAGPEPIEPEERERVEALLAYSRAIDPHDLFPTLVPGATHFVLGNSYAFALAACLERGMREEIVWTIPYYLREKLGHLEPVKIDAMTMEQLRALYHGLPLRPRYVAGAPHTTKALASLVVKQFGGDASRIWRDRKAAEVKATFERIWGVGPGIASTAVLLLEKAYGFRFGDLDPRQIDIRPDGHTMRVLYRMGLAPDQCEEAALAAARRLHPVYPGELEAPLWLIGRQFCRYARPSCYKCQVRDVCPKKGL